MRINGSIIGSVVTSSALSATGIWGLQNVELANRLNVWPAQIVTSGSVLFLDASNTNSYSGSGTTWYDLSGNGNTGTLTNGPTFSGVNGGTIVFDGTDDYVNCGNGTSLKLTSGTVTVWMKTTSTAVAYQGIVAKPLNYGIYNYGGNLLLYDWGTDTNRNSGISISDGNWKFITLNFVSNSPNNANVYINGVLVYTTTMYKTSDDYSLGISTGGGGIQLFPGTIGSVQIYNRSLSATEVLQNFNATRTRFGV